MFKIISTQNYPILFTNITEQSKLKNEKQNGQIVHVTISEAARNEWNESLHLKTVTENDKLGELFRQFYEEYNSVEAIEKRRLEQLEKEQSFNRLTDEFNLEGVEYIFPENTLHNTIKNALEGKVKNASIYASELAEAIRSTISMADKSAEERATYREMALRHAEYIADHYFDNEEEAAMFMTEITKYYENDILREKGYIVIDNSDIEPFKRYSSPISKEGEVSFYTLAKRYMDEEYFDRFMSGQGTPEQSAKYLMQIQNNKEKYTKEILEENALLEQQSEATIQAAMLLLDSLQWENGRVVASTEDSQQPDYLRDLLVWNENMLNLFIQ